MIEVEVASRHPEISIDLTGDPRKEIEIDIGAPHSGAAYPIYTGPTTVKPEAYTFQVLETEKKTVMDNIVVLPIPYYQTSNPQGGNTIYIGE